MLLLQSKILRLVRTDSTPFVVEMDGFGSLTHQDATTLNTALTEAGPDQCPRRRGLIPNFSKKIAKPYS